MPEVDLEHRVRSARADVEGALHPAPPALVAVRRRRARRRGAGALGLAAAVALVVAVVVAGGADGDGQSVRTGLADDASAPAVPPATAVPGAGTANADLLEPGAVRAIAPSPLAGRSDPASVWTGTEVVVWGGYAGDEEGAVADGAAYDPRTDRWRPLAPSPLSARSGPAAVWTGAEVIVWGGHGDTGGESEVISVEGGQATSPGSQRDGAAYDPATDTWRPIAPAPIESAGAPLALWTGTEMVVMAGFNSTDAAVYDPGTDTWRATPAPGRIVPPYPSATWTGTEAVVSLMSPEGDGNAAGVFAFDPATDRWWELPASPVDRTPMEVVWTGTAVVGVARDGRTVTYDPATEAWTAHGGAPGVTGAGGAVAVWTGARVLVWDGAAAATFDPAAGTWSGTPAGGTGGGGPVTNGVGVWADGVLVAWGGFPDRADGIVLRPAG